MNRVAPSSVVVSSRLSPELHQALQRIADEQERTVSWVVERLLRRVLEEDGELPPVDPSARKSRMSRPRRVP
jgi:hypothetical protein